MKQGSTTAGAPIPLNATRPSGFGVPVTIRHRLASMPGLLIGLAVSAGIGLRAPVSIDYSHDAGPGIQALLHGGWTELSAQPLMGPLSLVVRAPLVALVQALGADEL